MADQLISQLAAASVVHADDLLVIVDTHDTSMAASGTDKRITPAAFLASLAGDLSVSSLSATVGRVNGVTYPALPSLNTVPVVGAGNSVTYTQVPIAAGGTGQGSAAGAFGALSPLSAKGDLLAYSSANSRHAVGADGQVLTADSTQATGLKWSTVSGAGTVTAVSVVSANGFAGTVANASSAPAITISTSVTGLLKGNGTAVSAASVGTDYVAPSGNITGTASNVTGTVAIVNGGTGQTTATGAFGALSPLTTKGDLLGFGSSNSRLGVGSNGQALIADSAQTLGIKWGDPAIAEGQVTGLVTDLSTLSSSIATTAANAANASNLTSGTVAAARLPTTGLTITQHVSPITTDTDGATVTFDLSAADWHQVTLGGNRTLAISNATTGQQFSVALLQDATGSRTVTWFNTIKWAGGSAPTLTTTASKADVFTFKCVGTGSYWGFVAGQNI